MGAARRQNRVARLTAPHEGAESGNDPVKGGSVGQPQAMTLRDGLDLGHDALAHAGLAAGAGGPEPQRHPEPRFVLLRLRLVRRAS